MGETSAVCIPPSHHTAPLRTRPLHIVVPGSGPGMSPARCGVSSEWDTRTQGDAPSGPFLHSRLGWAWTSCTPCSQHLLCAWGCESLLGGGAAGFLPMHWLVGARGHQLMGAADSRSP